MTPVESGKSEPGRTKINDAAMLKGKPPVIKGTFSLLNEKKNKADE